MQLTHLVGHVPGTPRWSPDGQRIVFEMGSGRQSDLYLISAQGGQPKQLTNTPYNKAAPCFSRDGKWIYFGSTYSGDSQVWKLPAKGGDAVQVTRKSGSNPLESMDGKTLFYLKPKEPHDVELWKVPIEGGDESRVLEAIYKDNFDVKQRGIYYASKPDQNGTPFLFYDFGSGMTKHIATIRKDVEWGFTVSPDERWILFTQEGIEERSELMLVENFH